MIPLLMNQIITLVSFSEYNVQWIKCYIRPDTLQYIVSVIIPMAVYLLWKSGI